MAIGVLMAGTIGGLPGRAQAADSERWRSVDVPIFHNYTQEHGLPNPVVTALAQDGDGFLWIGTQGGLARWDGYRFRVYKPAAGVAGALPDSWVITLHIDRRGRLWVGTSAGGLARYDRDHDNFSTYNMGRGGPGNITVESIADDGDGLWIATQDGLNHLDTATGRIDTLRHLPGDPGSLPDNRVLAVICDRTGALWVGTRNGLARRPRGGARFVAVPLGDTATEEIAVRTLFEDTGGSVWIGTTQYGAFVVAPQQARARPVLETGPGGSSLQNESVQSISAGDGGEVWLGTYGRGIVVIDTVSGWTRRIHHEVSVLSSLANDTVWAVHRDRSGGVWVGTTNGLGRFDSRNAAVMTIFGETSNAHSLSGTDVESVMAAADGRIWLGIVGKGIDIVDPLVGRTANLPFNAGAPAKALPSMVVSMTELPGGAIFIGTNRGLYQADAAGTRVSRVVVAGRDPGIGSHALLQAGGKLWIGGTSDGLWAVVPGADAISASEHFDADRLTDRRVVTLIAGTHQDLWIGTRNGLNRLDLATHAVERILPSPQNPRALAAGYISTLLIDGSGRLWVGTLGGGIHVLIGQEAGTPIFRRVGTDQGLPDGNVDCLLTDATGRIWAATDNGIAVIDPVTFAVQPLNHADGVALSAYWAHAGVVTQAGELLFGGSGGGLTVIRPEKFRPWDDRPPLVVTDAKVGGKTVPANVFNGPGGHAILKVPPEANSLMVEFSVLDFSAPDGNRYAYRLEGFDHDWVVTDPTRRMAAYTNLSPGDYTLHLRGSNHRGVRSEATLNLPIRIQPAWYQTLWFKAAVAAALLACIVGLVQGRTVFLRRRQQELQRQVAERTAELEASKRQIEEIAYHDALTGLPNRRLFAADIRKRLALAEQQGNHFALLLVDLDRFKHINDTFGHEAGDAMLKEATKRLQSATRSQDIVARLGGDEFAILMGGLPGSDAGDKSAVEAICRRVVESFVTSLPFQGTEISTSASMGVALCPKHGLSQNDLYRAADMALYDAKRSGRNTWRWHSQAA